MRNTDWMARALCSGADPGWMSETKPEPPALAHLIAVCECCPVLGQCAEHALVTNAHSAIYAGVWLPLRGLNKPTKRWLAARARLAQRVSAVA